MAARRVACVTLLQGCFSSRAVYHAMMVSILKLACRLMRGSHSERLRADLLVDLDMSQLQLHAGAARGGAAAAVGCSGATVPVSRWPSHFMC